MNINNQFLIDLHDKSTDVNKGYYNLIVTIRDLKLYSIGIKPNRYFKITDVKKYFRLKGNAKQMLQKLIEIHEIVKNDRPN